MTPKKSRTAENLRYGLLRYDQLCAQVAEEEGGQGVADDDVEHERHQAEGMPILRISAKLIRSLRACIMPA